jgi:hypothetical protein
MSNFVVLCHKCSGLLTESEELQTVIGGCGCISSYIRDWQTAITPEEALYECLNNDINLQKFFTRRDGKPNEKISERVKRVENKIRELDC